MNTAFLSKIIILMNYNVQNLKKKKKKKITDFTLSNFLNIPKYKCEI